MESKVIEIYDEIREYCRDNYLRLRKFNIKGNHFIDIEIAIYEDIENDIQVYTFDSNDFEFKASITKVKSKHLDKLNGILKYYIY